MGNKRILVAGPCAAESAEQVQQTIEAAQGRSIDFVRLSLWKPRTKPGFEGLGDEGIPFLRLALESGLNPGTEILNLSNAETVLDQLTPHLGEGKIMLWIGARNQNHLLHREVSRLVSQDKRVTLLVKNQPWRSRDHWLGMVEHVLAGGIDPAQLLLCHRGFAPHEPHPRGYRNQPDFELSMQIKAETGLPMLFDPSHVGGSVSAVLELTKVADDYDFDGLMIEVHPNPSEALMDKNQQLGWQQFDALIASTGFGLD